MPTSSNPSKAEMDQFSSAVASSDSNVDPIFGNQFFRKRSGISFAATAVSSITRCLDLSSDGPAAANSTWPWQKLWFSTGVKVTDATFA